MIWPRKGIDHLKRWHLEGLNTKLAVRRRLSTNSKFCNVSPKDLPKTSMSSIYTRQRFQFRPYECRWRVCESERHHVEFVKS